MLRRVARVLRILFLVTGFLFLVLLLATGVLAVQIASPWPSAGIKIVAEHRYLQFSYATTSDGSSVYDAFYVSAGPTRPFAWDKALWPSTEQTDIAARQFSSTIYDLYVPLWLLAVLCLAWPVTSFIARRKARRGFPVEMPANASSLLSSFEHRVVRPEGGLLLFRAADAVDVVKAAAEAHVPILGLDGFRLFENGIQPSMEHSINFYGVEPNTWEASRRFIEDHKSAVDAFEIVLDEPAGSQPSGATLPAPDD